MKIGVSQLRGPVFVEPVVNLGFKTRDLRLADILEAVYHIGRSQPFEETAYVISVNIAGRVKIHSVTRKVGSHVIADTVMENIETRRCLAVFRFQTDIEVERFFRPQIPVADPVIPQPAQFTADAVNGSRR